MNDQLKEALDRSKDSRAAQGDGSSTGLHNQISIRRRFNKHQRTHKVDGHFKKSTSMNIELSETSAVRQPIGTAVLPTSSQVIEAYINVLERKLEERKALMKRAITALEESLNRLKLDYECCSHMETFAKLRLKITEHEAVIDELKKELEK